MPSSLASQLADTLSDGGWRAKARPEQLPPPGNWNGWLVMAGRGFGKTRTGSEWVKELVETGAAKRIALLAPTAQQPTRETCGLRDRSDF
jgi:phage terminase large subunit-like protein